MHWSEVIPLEKSFKSSWNPRDQAFQTIQAEHEFSLQTFDHQTAWCPVLIWGWRAQWHYLRGLEKPSPVLSPSQRNRKHHMMALSAAFGGTASCLVMEFHSLSASLWKTQAGPVFIQLRPEINSRPDPRQTPSSAGGCSLCLPSSSQTSLGVVVRVPFLRSSQ